MLKQITSWLLTQGILFATLFINLLSAGITVLVYLLVALVVSWWDKNT